jgi:hypothetical protein
MLGAMWIALTGGFSFHPFIPIVFTLTSAIVAFVPSSRKAGLTAALLWCVVAIGGSALTKYIGPLDFAAFGALTIAAAAAYSPRWAQWLLYPVAFIEAAWVASLVRQTAFEIAAVGHPTPSVDGCATALCRPISLLS